MSSSVKRLRLGIVGAGAVAETYHLGPLRTLEDVEIVWVCDTDRARARYLAGLAKVSLTATAVDECPEADVALVAIPVGPRRAVVEKVAARGWHALCEKPFARSLDDHRAIVAAARNHGVRLGVGLVRRQYAATKTAAEVLRSGVLGPVQTILAGEGMAMHRTGRGADWYQASAEASGGSLMETGSHLADQVFTLCGAIGFEIERCSQRVWNGLEFETSVAGRLEMESGDRAPFAFVVSRLHDVYNGIVVRCANGELRVGLAPEAQPEIFSREGKKISTLHGAAPATPNVHVAIRSEWQDFLSACRTSKNFTDWDTGLMTTAFLEQCYAIAQGRAYSATGERR